MFPNPCTSYDQIIFLNRWECTKLNESRCSSHTEWCVVRDNPIRELEHSSTAFGHSSFRYSAFRGTAILVQEFECKLKMPLDQQISAFRSNDAILRSRALNVYNRLV